MSDQSDSNFSRREFLKAGALSGLAFMPFARAGARQTERNPAGFYGRGEAKNIIFMVADGMSSGTLNMADLIKRRQYGSPSHWMNLYNSNRKFHRGLMDMASLNSPVTDSAAASSSWGSGHRINNGAVNMGPNGEKYPPIHQLFKDAGKKTGLVTTTRITHATPAGFGANVEDRGSEDEIAAQYLQRAYDLMLGGGARHFNPDHRDDGQDLLAGFSEKGYRVVRNGKELSRAGKGERLLGLFHDSHLPYSIDHQHMDKYKNSVPTLAEMTDVALQNLESPEGFILQVEGGRVDHGAHDNDAAGMLYDQVAFDDAVKIALDYVDSRDDTLLIITTDHGNGNPALNGAGSRYSETAAKFDRLQDFRYSNTWILNGLDDESTISDIRERVQEATRLEITKNEADFLKQSLNGSVDRPYDIQEAPDSVLGGILANYTSINFTSGNHTSDYVELAAIGPGIENLDHFTRNTELFDLMVKAAGVNANMSLAD